MLDDVQRRAGVTAAAAAAAADDDDDDDDNEDDNDDTATGFLATATYCCCLPVCCCWCKHRQTAALAHRVDYFVSLLRATIRLLLPLSIVLLLPLLLLPLLLSCCYSTWSSSSCELAGVHAYNRGLAPRRFRPCWRRHPF